MCQVAALLRSPAGCSDATSLGSDPGNLLPLLGDSWHLLANYNCTYNHIGTLKQLIRGL